MTNSASEPSQAIASHAFFLADYAAIESSKAYVSGGFWDRIAMPEFPSAGYFTVVAIIKVPWSAYNVLHAFAISVEDEAGEELPARFDGEFQVSNAPYQRVGDPTILPMAAVLNGMPFEGPGDFSFILRVDEVEIDRWPLRVTLVEAESESQPSLGGFDIPMGLPPSLS